MKRLLFLFSFFIICNSFSQNQQKADTIGADIFGALYTLKNNTLFKKVDDTTIDYQNLALGDVTTVDIINSREIVIFYLDYNAVVILDNQLNLITQIQFAQTILFVNKGIVNNLWRYNDSKNILELYDYKSRTITSTSQIITDFEPVKMESNFNSVKLIGVDKTLMFDQYLNITETVIHQKND
ncbi:MAG: hypothetical protein PSN34_00680 [Urechidicola sp.]|nr:hypothetical protein [Urechidicola sp.]